MSELIEQARLVADNATLMDRRGELVCALRATGLSWRQIQAQTGIEQTNARRWLRRWHQARLD